MINTSPKHSRTAVRLIVLVVAAILASACSPTATTGTSDDAQQTGQSSKATAQTTSTSAGAIRPDTDQPDTAKPTTPKTNGGTPATPSFTSYPTGIVPTSIEIPAIGLRATTIELDLTGPLPEVPEDADQTGWYDQTRRPGEIGPAVIAGHIDTTTGPAVFARLDELEPGDEIVVNDANGQQRRFTVHRSGQYPKGDLPAEVFGFDQPTPELRLITCGGSFDRSTGHYRDNYVVYAIQSNESPTPTP